MNGHTGPLVAHCPVCRELPPTASTGLGLAARLLLHDAADDREVELAELADWVVSAHGPRVDGSCRGCDDNWHDLIAHFGAPVPCQVWQDIRSEINAALLPRVQTVKDRHL